VKVETDCTLRKDVPFLVNACRPEDREKLERLGQDLAQKEGFRFEGYSLCTLEPYSIDKAKATLFFA